MSLRERSVLPKLWRMMQDVVLESGIEPHGGVLEGPAKKRQEGAVSVSR